MFSVSVCAQGGGQDRGTWKKRKHQRGVQGEDRIRRGKPLLFPSGSVLARLHSCRIRRQSAWRSYRRCGESSRVDACMHEGLPRGYMHNRRKKKEKLVALLTWTKGGNGSCLHKYKFSVTGFFQVSVDTTESSDSIWQLIGYGLKNHRSVLINKAGKSKIKLRDRKTDTRTQAHTCTRLHTRRKGKSP